MTDSDSIYNRVNQQPQQAEDEPVDTVDHLKSEVEYRTRLQEITNAIYAASSLDEILFDLKDEIVELAGAERITVYYVDGIRWELVSRFKSGDEISEIRLPINNSSIAGYCAANRKILNIGDVYESRELFDLDADLGFDSSWDSKTGFKTKQVLVAPIVFKSFPLGVVQLINRKEGGSFTDHDEQNISELAKIMGIALYNQKRLAASRKSKFDYLLENHIVARKELDNAIADARQKKVPIEIYLMENLKISKKDILEALSRYYDIPWIEFRNDLPIPSELLRGLNVPFMKKNAWVPIRSENGDVLIAIDNPDDLKRLDEIKTLFQGRTVKLAIAVKADIIQIIKHFIGNETSPSSIDEILSRLQEDDYEDEEETETVNEESGAVVQLVNKMILDAHARGASDIHLEPYPGRQNTRVRIRVDGACTLYQTIPYSYKNAVVARIKIMADLDIAEKRKPQDGKIRFKKFGGRDIELRVATVPTQGGFEDVVMRILAAGEPLPLDRMGFSRCNYDTFAEAVSKPYGMILVCGPTGSGKTTTLHSALRYINNIERKIWTAEDPVEITQKGLRQVQVKPKIGYNFASAMRAFLRADPDVIMVGEMRDHETTQMGIEASLTGHLVFSTLHTNSAPETVTRLLDMGMDPFNFADALICILAQRLVRTLCSECRQPYHPDSDEYDELVREYRPEQFKLHLNIPYSEDLIFYAPKGCPVCNNTGYRGRMGIHELLQASDEIKQLIQNRAMMTGIRDQAIKQGMTTLKQDGISKIFQGHCDLKEVRRVCIR